MKSPLQPKPTITTSARSNVGRSQVDLSRSARALAAPKVSSPNGFIRGGQDRPSIALDAEPVLLLRRQRGLVAVARARRRMGPRQLAQGVPIWRSMYCGSADFDRARRPR